VAGVRPGGGSRLAPARARSAFAAAFRARAPAATPAAPALLLGGALFAGLAEDLAHAFAFLVACDAFARLPRLRHQQFGGHRLDRDLLLDVGLDVGQR